MRLKDRLHQLILFPFLLPVFYILHVERYLHQAIPVVGAVEVLALYTLIITGIYLILRKCSKYGAGAGLATALIMVQFIYWGELVPRVNKLLHSANYTYLPVFLLLWVVAALLLAKLLNRQPEKPRNKIVFFCNNLVPAIYPGRAWIDGYGCIAAAT